MCFYSFPSFLLRRLTFLLAEKNPFVKCDNFHWLQCLSISAILFCSMLLNALFLSLIIRPLPEGGLLWFVPVVLFLYLVQSQKSQHIESALGNGWAGGNEPHCPTPEPFHWYSLQKSRMLIGRIGIFSL